MTDQIPAPDEPADPENHGRLRIARLLGWSMGFSLGVLIGLHYVLYLARGDVPSNPATLLWLLFVVSWLKLRADAAKVSRAEVQVVDHTIAKQLLPGVAAGAAAGSALGFLVA